MHVRPFLCALQIIVLVAGASGLWESLVPTETQAQTRVRDKRLRDRTQTENAKRAAEIILRLEQLDEMRRQAEQLSVLVDRALAVGSVTEAVDLVVGFGDAIGYSTADLEVVFDATFGGYTLPADATVYHEAQAERLLNTYENLLVAVQQQMAQFEDAFLALEGFKRQAEDEADNQLKALQLQAAVEVYKAEEMLLLRQALALQANAQALVGAYRTNKEAMARAVLRRALGAE